MGLVQEFKEFALKGNVVDMAVGVIIGGAFGKIVSSMVSDIIMPAVGVATGGANFTDLKLILKEAQLAADGKVIAEAVTVNYGNFLQTTFDFLVVALCIFAMIKVMNQWKKEAPTPEEPSAPPEDVVLLREIRDSLKR